MKFFFHYLALNALCIILLFAVCSITQSQSVPASPNNAQNDSSTKARISPPKAIATPGPDPTSDHGEFITVISLIVGVDGRVHDPKVTKPSSSTKADANAMDAVRRWKFKPATKDGVPFAVRISANVKCAVH